MKKKRKKTNARDRMSATNDLVRKWMSLHGHSNFKIFRHGLGSKDYYINDCGFDSLSFVGPVLWFLQHKTNDRCRQSELDKYEEIERDYNVKCGWVSWNTKKKQLEFWSVKCRNGMIMNKEIPTSLKP